MKLYLDNSHIYATRSTTSYARYASVFSSTLYNLIEAYQADISQADHAKCEHYMLEEMFFYSTQFSDQDVLSDQTYDPLYAF